MITIVMHPEVPGKGTNDPWIPHTCEWNGKTYAIEYRHRRAELCYLTRMLIEDGCEDQPWEAVDSETGKVRMKGKSIRWYADRQLSETDRNFGYVKFVPYPS